MSGRYFHPSSIPAAVVEKSLAEIEDFLATAAACAGDEERGRLLTGKARAVAYELKNILVCGKTDNLP